METDIRIRAGKVEAEATLNDTETAKTIADALPITGEANRWGDEIYFAISVKVEKTENAREVVEMGDLGYWIQGSAFCIFFGPTPASRGDEIRPADPVNIFGRIKGDPKVFKAVSEGEKVIVEKA